ncbi:MAG TPA: MFS transporter [Euzebyales bacterium]|nr:MFS transporter [Euzebyales bacterium]
MRLPATRRLHLHSWLHRTVVAVALLGVASGFAQYAVTASLADVASAFGADGDDLATVGLSATTVGIGLAIIRFASLGALPLSSVADRLGRRRVLIGTTAVGLGLTVLAAASPTFWWFVAIIAIGRPLLTAANAVGSVVVSEETTSAHRTKAVALAIAGYGLGVGIVSVLRVPINELSGLGFRGLFAFTLVPLLAMPLIGRLISEPDRFVVLSKQVATRPRLRGLTSVHPTLRSRLWILVALTFAFNFVTGPVNTFLFFYAEGELGVSPATMAAAVVAAGVLGPAGLLVGRWAADRLGRRMGSLLPHALLAVSGVLVYSGTPAMLLVGYWAGVLAQGAYGTAFGALSTEVFPTSHRATAQGWLAGAGVAGAVAGLLLFGAISDITASFVVAALSVCIPCGLAAVGYLPLPETRGMELEESAPEVAL